ncbi:hypothetical protein CRUP_002226 [Coryphaenoides rupestris]|nr:hypothetical protein CRUP_002226 [Coryphaenoides rupestris]
MVKLTFGAVLAGKKDALLPVAADDDDDDAAAGGGGRLDLEDGQCVDSRRSTLWCWCMCLGLGLMLAGVVDTPIYFCSVGYSETDYIEGVESEEEGVGNMAAAHQQEQRYLEERVRVLVEEEVEFIDAGTYLPQSYLVREQMVVTERLDLLDGLDNLGMFIHSMCRGRPTYRLEHRATIKGIHKREALNCHKIRHFENTFVVETQICEL